MLWEEIGFTFVYNSLAAWLVQMLFVRPLLRFLFISHNIYCWESPFLPSLSVPCLIAGIELFRPPRIVLVIFWVVATRSERFERIERIKRQHEFWEIGCNELNGWSELNELNEWNELNELNGWNELSESASDKNENCFNFMLWATHSN